uniref:Nudix hydrolase domain-containing protein n=1 Tax=Parascaris univalens TaxID=6257 RepID=A0A915CFI8_PARUN
LSPRRSLSSVRTITLDDILKEKFKERVQNSRPPIHPRFYIRVIPSPERNSAVLVPLLNVKGRPSVLFTHRSLLLSGHRGEICFPGGRLERNETPEQGALRESAEEIGIDKCSVEIWSRLRPMLTRNLRSIVTPVVGVLPDVELRSLKPRTHEVQTIFTAPLEELCRNHRYTRFKRGTAEWSLPVFTTTEFTTVCSTSEYQPREYRIWGLSAGILHLTLIHLLPALYNSEIEIAVPV